MILEVFSNLHDSMILMVLVFVLGSGKRGCSARRKGKAGCVEGNPLGLWSCCFGGGGGGHQSEGSPLPVLITTLALPAVWQLQLHMGEHFKKLLSYAGTAARGGSQYKGPRQITFGQDTFECGYFWVFFSVFYKVLSLCWFESSTLQMASSL